ncbi:HEXXH motif domain-containing protein [Sphaerisporangium sp. B11E5]|uniref:HEXXH motif domain-containing protein n=1 Tax=Sphaerisporangium sp. B11E5 TaxID=3153563 RepID=UPI00325F44CF
MSPPHHVVPDEHFHALAAGGGGAASVGLLARAEYSKHLLLLRGVVEAARTARHPDAGAARDAYTLLSAAQKCHAAAADAVLRHPAVGAWAWRTFRALDRGDPSPPHAPARLAAVAAAAAVRAGKPFAVEVPVEDGGVMLPSLGRAAASGTTALVRRTTGDAEVVSPGYRVLVPRDPHQDTPGWQGLRRLSVTAKGRSLHLLIDDLDPYRMPGAHVSNERLPASEVERWLRLLHEAWVILRTHHWTIADEVAAAIRVLTPLDSLADDQTSGSSRETFGSIALSSPPDARTMALTFAHEVQHGKLSALLDVIPLLHPAPGRRYYAPWRPDPRPLGGLLQGAYAYIGVSGFWRRQRHHESADSAVAANAEFCRWREAAEQTADTIASSGHLTAHGKIFVDGMTRTLRDWAREDVPPAAVVRARRDAAGHRTHWLARNSDDVNGASPGGGAVHG